MTLVFPLAIADFFDLLPIGRFRFELGEALEQNRTLGGTQLSADLGERLWQGEIALGKMTWDEVALVEPRLDVLREAGRSFVLYDPRQPFPAADPGGAILGSAVVTIDTLEPDAAALTLTGLPIGYVLSPGDRMSFAYQTNGVIRQAMHRVVVGTMADAFGRAGPIMVSPHIRDGVALGAAVALIRPSCRAVIVAGSASIGDSRRTVTEGATFRFVQTLGG